MAGFTLECIAAELGAELNGDPALTVTGLQALHRAGPTELSFLANHRYRSSLAETRAAAVLLRAEDAPACPVATLVVADPYLAYARLSHWFAARNDEMPGVDAAARVDASAEVHPTACVGPGAVIGPRTRVAAAAVVGAGTVVGADCRIGIGSRLYPNVTLYRGVTLGEHCVVHSGAVVGADGFGYAWSDNGWVKIAQNGGVRIGDRVEIGAGTTIDRGALDDTVIADGVIIDNQVQVAHNVRIGKHTAIAGCTAIAGSTTIGARCTIAGAVGITGHLIIADDVHITAMSLISKSIDTPGAYSSGTAMAPTPRWRKSAVRFLQLERLFKRVAALEKRIQNKS